MRQQKESRKAEFGEPPRFSGFVMHCALKSWILGFSYAGVKRLNYLINLTIFEYTRPNPPNRHQFFPPARAMTLTGQNLKAIFSKAR